MIEIKSLPQTEQEMLKATAVSFFLSYTKQKPLMPLFKEIKEVTGLGDSYDKEIWMMITCCAKALKSGTCYSELSLSADSYTFVSSKYGIKLHQTRAKKVVDILDEVGYITFYKGYTDVRSDDWCRSIVLFHERFTNSIAPSVLNLFKSYLDDIEIIEVRDENKNDLVLQKKFKGISSKREDVMAYNRVLSGATVMLFDCKCQVAYKRVFADDFNGGGRFYSVGMFQRMSSKFRQYLKINGNPVTEVDISNLHVNILSTLQGVVVDKSVDQYDVEGHERGHAKFAMLCIINCPTKNAAINAVLWNLKKEKYNRARCVDLIDKLIAKSSPVKFFGDGVANWKTLQRLDSEICAYVIKSFVSIGVPVLSYHDSWIVEAEYQKLLIDTIQKAWKTVMRVDTECKVKIDY